ncbi:helix-turn-helix domain-containing protein [Listeria ivanovii]|uniref:Putative transcription regulator n=1 Tax=Listeria ivanovii (strain ATCC BAA-678 / PAM 55) TaxID=881621 RepID=G2ZDI3_LISIP|nr:helix-turn-helix transcriptional regulator [Listeria ivanovii]AHI56599.1 DNA-binding protein [Listeria ivanovii WSLC3009]AIS66017.1 DNA-binding protein [Listeria ivanovii subsp. ivanovii]MBK3913965.1 helix-turn-helix transcriptional regulator [Listeria ivanovii subsp. ivanovii]MBK3921197.1 helix-turn-helix transcriptional regulator [Listeria ivanovii subsp. ivanovii]MBK3926361.1 helix-turn-helix transcriptional regulator [Listeria ivanovii subsp. ivanovii]
MSLIGLRIRNIRKAKKLTLKDVAQGIISVPYLANIENGVKTPSIETLMHIAVRLEVPEEILLVNEEEVNKELLWEIQTIFELIVQSNVPEAQAKLSNIAENIDLRYESVAIELGFYSLQAGLYYKTWKFSKAEQIKRAYLENNAKRSIDKFPEYLQIYYYYCHAIKNANATCDYKLARDYWEKCIKLSNNPEFDVIFHLNICTFYICDSEYEPALEHVAQALDLVQSFPCEKQERIISTLYFYGYIYYQIGFMGKAKNYFEQAMTYFPMFPEVKKTFYFLLCFKLAEVERLEGNEAKFNQLMLALYQEIVAHKSSGFVNNDFLVITELMVIFAEIGSLQEAKELLEIMNDVDERVMELDFFMEYTKTLIYFHQKEQTSYEQNMMKLLKKINVSNDPMLIERVKKHASKHFANETKYKLAYAILS